MSCIYFYNCLWCYLANNIRNIDHYVTLKFRKAKTFEFVFMTIIKIVN